MFRATRECPICLGTGGSAYYHWCLDCGGSGRTPLGVVRVALAVAAILLINVLPFLWFFGCLWWVTALAAYLPVTLILWIWAQSEDVRVERV